MLQRGERLQRSEVHERVVGQIRPFKPGGVLEARQVDDPFTLGAEIGQRPQVHIRDRLPGRLSEGPLQNPAQVLVGNLNGNRRRHGRRRCLDRRRTLAARVHRPHLEAIRRAVLEVRHRVARRPGAAAGNPRPRAPSPVADALPVIPSDGCRDRRPRQLDLAVAGFRGQARGLRRRRNRPWCPPVARLAAPAARENEHKRHHAGQVRCASTRSRRCRSTARQAGLQIRPSLEIRLTVLAIKTALTTSVFL